MCWCWVSESILPSFAFHKSSEAARIGSSCKCMIPLGSCRGANVEKCGSDIRGILISEEIYYTKKVHASSGPYDAHNSTRMIKVANIGKPHTLPLLLIQGSTLSLCPCFLFTRAIISIVSHCFSSCIFGQPLSTSSPTEFPKLHDPFNPIFIE